MDAGMHEACALILGAPGTGLLLVKIIIPGCIHISEIQKFC